MPSDPVFERRVRALVRRLMRMHPGMAYDVAMLRARKLPPRKLAAALPKLSAHLSRKPYVVQVIPIPPPVGKVSRVRVSHTGPFVTHRMGLFNAETAKAAAQKRWTRRPSEV